jgi:hypothetical protein
MIERGQIGDFKAFEEERAWHELTNAIRKRFPVAKEPEREKKIWELFPDGDYEGGIMRLLSEPRDP